MEHRWETSPDYKMNFPNKWCSAKVANRFSSAATALTAYALGTSLHSCIGKSIAYDNFFLGNTALRGGF
jgi:hypothetical protein